MGHGVKKFIAEENWLQNCKYLLQGCIDCILMICGPLEVKLKTKFDCGVFGRRTARILR